MSSAREAGLRMVNRGNALPFGISSHGRGLPDVDGVPFIVAKSHGSRLIDPDGRSHVDYCMGIGANLLGHAHPVVVAACEKALRDGSMPGFRHEGEEQAAEDLAQVGGRLSKVTFTSTGSEAVHLACRIARGHTGKKLIAKAVGGYNGWYDEFRFGMVESPESRHGNERPRNSDFTLFRVNDTPDLESLFKDHRDELAAIIIEPVLGNAGCLAPSPAFCAEITRLARANGVLVIADEVMVGLRLGLKSVAEQVGLTPDLMTMGKAIGSGMPVAAVLGTPDAFDVVENGKVVCYGTYQGNPVVAAAVSATIDFMRKADFNALFAYGDDLRTLMTSAFTRHGIGVSTSGLPTIFTIWFSETPPRDYLHALDLVRRDASRFVHDELRRHGVVTLPIPWGRIFFSFSHGLEDREITAQAYEQAAAALAKSGILDRPPATSA